MGVKIVGVDVRDFRAIRALHMDVPPSGVLVTGANKLGKTSFLKAITTALAGKGVSPEAIRKGADDCEVLIDMGHLRIRKTITQKGDSLQVTSPEGAIYAKPQTMLNELLGSSALDPVMFYFAKPREQREMILEAIPLRVTREQIERWTGVSLASGSIFGMPVTGKFETMHGLDVIATLHKLWFDQRATANKEAKSAENAREVARADMKALPQVPLTTPTRKDAEAALTAAERTDHELEARRTSAIRAAAAVASTRTRIADLRARADAKEEAIPAAAATEDVQRLSERQRELTIECDRLAHLLAQARADLASVDGLLTDIAQAAEESDRARVEIAGMREDARQLEASLSDVAGLDVTDAELSAAAAAVSVARENVALAEKADDLRAAITKLDRLDKEAQAAAARAAKLTEVVDFLARDAPAELAQSPEMIPGLAMDGDKITLDGVALDGRSGAEQMEFAVTLAKRLNHKSKILLVDGLERFDSKQFDLFVKMATADDWQVFGTRVADGDIKHQAIIHDEEPGTP